MKAEYEAVERPRNGLASGAPIPFGGQPVPLPASLLQSELARIVSSATFRNASRHSRLLTYLVSYALRGDGSRLKEMTLGIDVFDRRASNFDPERDTIVRVEVRRLRARLARYYQSEGADSLTELALPVGSYSIALVRRATLENAASLAVLPIAAAIGDRQHSQRRSVFKRGAAYQRD